MNPIRLDVGEFGEGVAELHSKLLRHGYQIPATELERKFFGPATREAVRACQNEHGLPDTGTVDTATVRVLEVAVASRAHSSVTAKPEHPLATSSSTKMTLDPSAVPTVGGSSEGQPTPAASPLEIHGSFVVHGQVRHI